MSSCWMKLKTSYYGTRKAFSANTPFELGAFSIYLLYKNNTVEYEFNQENAWIAIQTRDYENDRDC